MQVTIKVHSTLREYTNNLATMTFKAADFSDVISALTNQFPKMRKYMNTIEVSGNPENIAFYDINKDPVTRDHMLLNKITSKHKELYLVPMVYGAGGNTGTFLAIAAIVAVGVMTGGFGLSAAPALASVGPGLMALAPAATSGGFFAGIAGKMLTSVAINLALGFVSRLFSKTPKKQEATPKDSETRKDNNIFGSLANTTSTQTPVALIYGLTRASGQFVSGYLETIHHTKDEEVEVRDFISY